ncbi:hypothetical protein [Streptomyces aidingensis]|uniref:Large membrane protein n=1 Tax=Streptomyces aidingensis TaxID=910347 RepID=A0A1I1LFV8_9ACTN|nr:hypothetical protein [Streptomyces aidingensis]SFC71846.1 hypothetical protein SAMN05421773_105202 [Streptomyces aidingensis]
MSDKESPEETSGTSGAEAVPPEPPDSPDRRRHWPAVAAVTGSVVLLAGALYGGGALLAAGDGSGGRPDPLVLDDLGGGGAAQRDGAAEEALEAGTSMPAFSGLRYEAVVELPQGPESAPVHEFTGEVDEAKVAALAGAFGLADSLERKDGYWTAGGGTGRQDPMLVVTADAMGQWHLTSHPMEPEELIPDLGTTGSPETLESPRDAEARDRDLAAEEAAKAAGQDAAEPALPAGEVPTEEPGPGDDDGFGLGDAPEPEQTLPPVSGKAALAAVRPALEVLGLADAPADTSSAWGEVRTVMVQDEVAGLPVYGSYTFFEVGPEGEVTGGWGALAETAPGEEYPLVGAAEALELLNERYAAPADGPVSADAAGPAVEPAAAPEPLEVTGAELGLSLHHSRGEPLLVPAWLFRGGQEQAGSAHVAGHPAVDPEFLAGPDTGAGNGDTDGGTDSAPDGDTPVGRGGSEPGSKGSDGDGGAPAPDQGGGADAGEPEPGGEPVDPGVYVEPYRPGDTTLTYHYWTGVCQTYTVTAEETATTVTLRVTGSGQKEGEACILIAEEAVSQVTLEEPVGDRTILDGHGDPVPVR